jgi:uncharacterized protein
MRCFSIRRAVITGATSGIGYALAHLLASEGAELTIGGRRGELLEERKLALEKAGATAVHLVIGDLAEDSTIRGFERAIRDAQLDLLCNSAGFGVSGAIGAVEVGTLKKMLTVHAEALLRLTDAAIRRMSDSGGMIINVGSLAGTAPVPGAATYVATKAFVERFSESVAIEASRHAIAVQALTPGFVKTDFHRDVSDYRSKQTSKGLIRWLEADRVAAISLKRVRVAHRRLKAKPGRLPRRRDAVVIPGFWYRVIAAIAPLLPRRIIYRAASSREQM